MSPLPNLDPAVANVAYIELCASLTWLFEDTSEDSLTRCRSALDTIDSLRPATAMEARFAVQFVAADICANACLGESTEPGADFAKVSKCRAQATAMMRLTHRAVDRLLTLQRQRRHESSRLPAADAGFSAAEDAAATLAAWQATPLPRTAPPPAPADAAADPPQPALAAADPSPRSATDIPQAALDKAAAFIRRNRPLALRIRRAGGLTADVGKGFRPAALPRDRALIDAIVHGTGAIFAALDGGGCDERRAA